MCDSALWLRFGRNDLAAGSQVNVMEQIFAGRWNANRHTGLLQHPKELSAVYLRLHSESLRSSSSRCCLRL